MAVSFRPIADSHWILSRVKSAAEADVQRHPPIWGGNVRHCRQNDGVRDGQRVVTNTGLSFIGSIFYVFLLVAAVALYM
jgi:hypothetical protein